MLRRKACHAIIRVFLEVNFDGFLFLLFLFFSLGSDVFFCLCVFVWLFLWGWDFFFNLLLSCHSVCERESESRILNEESPHMVCETHCSI